jgi:hypothetical protein
MKYIFIVCCTLVVFSCTNSSSDRAKGANTIVDTLQDGDKSLQKKFKITAFDKSKNPLHDSIKGELLEGLSWMDLNGEHLALFSSIPVKMSENNGQSGAIFAYCFDKKGDSWTKQWMVQDRIDACEVDATCEFFPGSFSITDMDNNQVGEISFLYKLSCKGDVSPDEKKLILYEGATKYAIRGSTIIEYDQQREGGEKKPDARFVTAAKPIQDFAMAQWEKFGYTKY